MGLAKERMMEIEARGFGETGKYVCSGCIGDEYLVKKFIRPKGEHGSCSFCKDDNGKPIRHRKVYPLESLMVEVMPAIRYYFMPADGNIPWDNGTKSYMGSIRDPWDFVHVDLAEELRTENMDLLDEVMNILELEDRASVFEYHDRRSEEDLKAWNDFTKFVGQCGDMSVEEIVRKCLDRNASEKYKDLRITLWSVLNHAREMYAFRQVNTGVSLYRCVNYIPKKYLSSGTNVIPAKAVGTAPKDFAANGRFNEKGDMMFYGASSASVAMAEVDKKDDNPYTIGAFHTNKRIKVLDLSAIADWKRPSAFDLKQESIECRESWFFLQRFIDIISMPVDDRDSSFAQAYYRPIQVFMKYIQRASGLYGIVYRSTKSKRNDRYSNYPTDLCYVLFAGHDDCYDAVEWDTKLNKSKGLQLFMEKVWQVDA